MPSPQVPQYDLTGSEKIMLRAFIKGTQVGLATGQQENIWTEGTLIALRDILDGKYESLNSSSAQDLLCIFADLVISEGQRQGGDPEFSKLMVKFMHHLVSRIDWTFEKKERSRPGPKPLPAQAPQEAAPAQPNSGQEAATA